VIRFEQGSFDEAVVHFEAALRADPGNVDARANIGFIRLAEGRRGEALAAFDQALAAAPDHVRARTGRARTLFEQGEEEDAIAAFRAALALDPRDPETNFQLGVAEARRGDDTTGEKLIGRALALDPAMFKARWKAALLLPRIYDSSDHVEASRARWSERVAALEADLDLTTPEAVSRAVEAIKTTTNFDLHYQGHDDRPMQELYGRILSRVAAARYPELAARPEPRARDGKLRVGFVSSFLYDHTIFKIYNAWITDLTDAIETYVYYKGRSRIPRSSICATAPIISNMSPAPNSSSPRRAATTSTC